MSKHKSDKIGRLRDRKVRGEIWLILTLLATSIMMLIAYLTYVRDSLNGFGSPNSKPTIDHIRKPSELKSRSHLCLADRATMAAVVVNSKYDTDQNLSNAILPILGKKGYIVTLSHFKSEISYGDNNNFAFTAPAEDLFYLLADDRCAFILLIVGRTIYFDNPDLGNIVTVKYFGRVRLASVANTITHSFSLYETGVGFDRYHAYDQLMEKIGKIMSEEVPALGNIKE